MTATLTSSATSRERDRVLPDLGDLVARLGHDLDRPDALAVDDRPARRGSRPAARSAPRTSAAPAARSSLRGAHAGARARAGCRPHPSRRSGRGAPAAIARRDRRGTARPAPPAASGRPPRSPAAAASSIEAAISTRVAVRALRMVTPPATSAATMSISTNTIRSWVRTERPYHSACARPLCGSRGNAGARSGRLSDDALMGDLPR